LALVPPFTGGNQWKILHKVMEGALVPPSERAPARQIPRELEAAVLKAMAKDPAKRYPSVAGLRADIEAYLAGRTLAAARYTPWQRAAKWVMRNKAVSAVAGVSLVVILGFVVAVVATAVRATRGEKAALEAKAEAQSNLELAEENATKAEAALAKEREAKARGDEKARREGAFGKATRLAWEALESGEFSPVAPAKTPRYREWLDEVSALVAERGSHMDERTRLEALASPAEEETAALRMEGAILSALEKLESEAVPEVKRWLEMAGQVEAAKTRYSPEWEQARNSIADESRCPMYAGLRLPAIEGLVPLGQDPDSHLWEFAHVATGTPPVRGADGRLTIAEATGIVLVLVPPGSFQMGSDTSKYADERPAHPVTVPAFLIAKYEMTQTQWKRATGEEPSYYKGEPLRPVEQVSWDDCRGVLSRLGLRLPSEAEWEYAARAGTTTEWWICDDDHQELLATAGNLADQTGVKRGLAQGEKWDDGEGPPARVGSYRANPFGLHDTIGNVWEWCEDSYHDTYGGAPADGSPWVEKGASGRVLRGGGCSVLAVGARSAIRYKYAASGRDIIVGVRPARAIYNAE
ncbi:MAG: SUMF1/EgtB/PvdO family nonheme iron enzyme, partial [Planctomycetes bacterium]|nr:SUMF1/EgtB/PvdO family nonheme iron enzyme [Planctomycetota bacterium]